MHICGIGGDGLINHKLECRERQTRPCRGHRAMMYHYSDVIMRPIASKITNLTMVYSTINSGAGQRKHQSSALLPFVRGIHRWPVNSPHKGPVTRKMFPFDDVIMFCKKFISGQYIGLSHSTSIKHNLMICSRDDPDNLVNAYSNFLSRLILSISLWYLISTRKYLEFKLSKLPNHSSILF